MIGKLYLAMAWAILYLLCYLVAPPSLQNWRIFAALVLMHFGSWFLDVVERTMNGHG